MRRSIVAFVVGCLITSLAWYAIGRYINRAQDQTGHFPDKLRATMQGSPFGLLTHAYARRFPGWVVFTPTEKNQLLAFAQIGSAASSNVLMLWDSDTNGIPDSITLMDAAQKAISMSISESEGVWEKWDFSAIPKGGRSYMDIDMDGQPDILTDLSGPSGHVFLKGQWHQVQKDQDQSYVVVNGRTEHFSMKDFIRSKKQGKP